MKKFIAQKPQGREAITIRLPKNVLEKVDDKAATVGISRNELINQMLVYALSNMDK